MAHIEYTHVHFNMLGFESREGAPALFVLRALPRLPDPLDEAELEEEATEVVLCELRSVQHLDARANLLPRACKRAVEFKLGLSCCEHWCSSTAAHARCMLLNIAEKTLNERVLFAQERLRRFVLVRRLELRREVFVDAAPVPHEVFDFLWPSIADKQVLKVSHKSAHAQP